MASITQKFEDSMGHLKGVLAGVGITLGAGALAAWVATAIRGGAAAQDTATRVGMTSEAFQKLGYAAKISGVDQEQLAGSLEKMQERLAEVAIEGGGPAADALKRFGLNARDLTTMGTEQAFMKIVGVLEQIPNSMERMKVAKDIFGRSGSGMVNLAMEGTASLKALGAEASAVGYALSSIDNAKLAETDDAFDKIGMSITGISNSIAVELSPYITAVSDQFISWMKTGTTTGSYVAQAVDLVTTAIGFAADGVQVLKTAFFDWQSTVLDVLSKVTDGIGKVMANLEAIGTSKVTQLLAPAVSTAWESFGAEQKKALTESSTFFKGWSEELAKESAKSAEKSAAAWNKPWAHVGVQSLVDKLKLGSQERATFAADKIAKSVAPGAQVTPKAPTMGFAAAAESGTAAAYSARLGAQARLFDSQQNIIVQNTGKTAAATERIAIAIESQKIRAGGPVDGNQFRAQTSGM